MEVQCSWFVYIINGTRSGVLYLMKLKCCNMWHPKGNFRCDIDASRFRNTAENATRAVQRHCDFHLMSKQLTGCLRTCDTKEMAYRISGHGVIIILQISRVASQNKANFAPQLKQIHWLCTKDARCMATFSKYTLKLCINSFYYVETIKFKTNKMTRN